MLELIVNDWSLNFLFKTFPNFKDLTDFLLFEPFNYKFLNVCCLKFSSWELKGQL